MTVLWAIWLAILGTVPFLASWLWWESEMWINGAIPTHGFVPAVIGCVLALVLYYLVRLGDRRWRL
ncbi:MAG: hypothetical protein ISR47_02740 [Rhodospirillales bacterium]|nr:hypothetical protein [Rhodospirillales bacterium]